MTPIAQDARDYLAMRRGLGYKLRDAEYLLSDFIEFLKKKGSSYITAELALNWARLSPRGKPPLWGKRLTTVRVFAKHRSVADPRTEIPPNGILPSVYPRQAPYIYNAAEISRMLRAAGRLYPGSRLRNHTYRTIFGLLVVTGMRSGEARRLVRSDVDLHGRVLAIRESKFGKTRLVPLQPSTVEALERYAKRRDAVHPSPVTSAFFLSESGRTVGKQVLLMAFQKVRRKLGTRNAGSARQPRMHDLRHTFAVTTMLRWYRAGLDVERRLPILSTYLGHTHIWHTYWYLSAVPELLGLAGRRLERLLGELP